jgi:hypothetical protein
MALTVPSLYILTLAMFFINNFSYFQTNLSVHCISTRQKNCLHKPLITHASIQKGTTYSTIKVFNELPKYIKKLKHNKVQLKNTLSTCTYFLFI